MKSKENQAFPHVLNRKKEKNLHQSLLAGGWRKVKRALKRHHVKRQKDKGGLRRTAWDQRKEKNRHDRGS